MRGSADSVLKVSKLSTENAPWMILPYEWQVCLFKVIRLLLPFFCLVDPYSQLDLTSLSVFHSTRAYYLLGTTSNFLDPRGKSQLQLFTAYLAACLNNAIHIP